MPQMMSVTEAQDNFLALVQRVVGGGEPVIITSRNEPKVILFDYEIYRRKHGEVILNQYLTLAEQVVESTLEGYRPDSIDISLFPETFEQIIHDVWQVCRVLDKPRRMLAITLLDAVINMRESSERLTREHLEALRSVLPLLRRNSLTVDKVTEADLKLLAVGLNAVFPIEGDLVSLYEEAVEDEG